MDKLPDSMSASKITVDKDGIEQVNLDDFGFFLDDPLTAKEKLLRDNFFERTGVTRLCSFAHAANIVSIIGCLVFLFGVFDYAATQSLSRQIIFLGIAWFTDLIDGPIARKNNSVTAFGTAFDHGRDYAMFSWMIFLGIFNIKLIPEQFRILYLLIAISTIALLIILAKYVIAFFTIRRSVRLRCVPMKRAMFEKKFLGWFLRKRLQTTIAGRGSIASFALGDLFFLAGIELSYTYVVYIGVCILFLQPIFLGAYLYETILEPHQKFSAYERTIERLQKLRHPIRNRRHHKQEK